MIIFKIIAWLILLGILLLIFMWIFALAVPEVIKALEEWRKVSK